MTDSIQSPEEIPYVQTEYPIDVNQNKQTKQLPNYDVVTQIVLKENNSQKNKLLLIMSVLCGIFIIIGGFTAIKRLINWRN